MPSLRRAARLHSAGVDENIYEDFQVGQRVLTIEGLPGVVSAVEHGPHPGSEQYVVELDGGLGGGEYGHGELTAEDNPFPKEAKTAGVDLALIQRVRDEIVAAGECNSMGGPSCGVTSEELAPLLGGTEMYGAIRLPDGSAPEHAWVVMPDGTIIDATADQFGSEAILIIPPGDPRQQNYLNQEGDDTHTAKTSSLISDLEDDQEALDAAEATVTRTAADDYPELGTILEERPPPSHVTVLASRRGNGTDNCKFCGSDDLFGGHFDADGNADPNGQDGADWDVVCNSCGQFQNRKQPKEAGFWDYMKRVNDDLPAGVRYEEGGDQWHLNWCRFRKSERCMFPKHLNELATKEAGYAVWIPEDRGLCLRRTDAEQKDCPVSEPGPNSGEAVTYVDATIPWEQGGQRGGVPGKQYRSSKTAASEEIWMVRERPGTLAYGNATLHRASCHLVKNGGENVYEDEGLRGADAGYVFHYAGGYDICKRCIPEFSDPEWMAAHKKRPAYRDRMASKTAMPSFPAGNYEREIRKNRTTGTTVYVYDNTHDENVFDPDGGRWVTYCDPHGSLVNHDSLRLALYFAASPADWCEDCRDILNAKEQKNAKTAMPAVKGHTIRWFGVIPGGERVPRESSMPGKHWGWDATCSCGWDSKTGGAIQARVQEAVKTHLFQAANPIDLDDYRRYAKLGFHFTASWADVQAKAKRIRAAGGVRIVPPPPHMTDTLTFTAEVQGDNGVYETQLVRSLKGSTVESYACGCAWGKYAFDRSGPWKKYEGRMCSHALAALWEIQSRGMFGKPVSTDRNAPEWAKQPVRPEYTPKTRKKVAFKSAAVELRKRDRGSFGGTIEAFDGDRRVGFLDYAPDGFVENVEVEPEYRRQGLASQMAQRVEQEVGAVNPGDPEDSSNTSEGNAWINSWWNRAGALRPVSTDPELRVPPTHTAALTPLVDWVQIGGQLHQIIDVYGDGTAEVIGRGKVPTDAIVYPSYHPTLGLDLRERDVLAKGAKIVGPSRTEGERDDPKVKELEKRLLAKGGDTLVWVGDPDLDLVLAKGEFFGPSRLNPLWVGDPIRCHTNAGWLSLKHGHAQIYTGYALNYDGMWRSHSWCIDKQTGEILETTVERDAYYGAPVNNQEFRSSNDVGQGGHNPYKGLYFDVVKKKWVRESVKKTAAGGKLYHLADKVDFKLDPNFKPQNNTTLGGDWPEPGIFLTDSPEHWLNGYGYWRPYVVEFDVPSGVGKDFGREVFVPATDFSKIRITRVMPLDGWCREEYHEYGWTEEYFGFTFDTGEEIPPGRSRPPAGYRAPDARSMDSSWRSAYERKVKEMSRTKHNSIASKTAAADTDGVMIAIRPPESVCGALQIEGGEPLDNLHVTIAYLGDTADVDKDAFDRAMARISQAGFGAMTGRVQGYGTFFNEENVLWAVIDMPGLEKFRGLVMECLAAEGLVAADDYGWCPHLTLGYGDEFEAPDEIPSGAKGEWELDTVIGAYGGDWKNYAIDGAAEGQRVAKQASAFPERWVDMDDGDYHSYEDEGVGEAYVMWEGEDRWSYHAFTYDGLPERLRGEVSTLEEAKVICENHVSGGQASLFASKTAAQIVIPLPPGESPLPSGTVRAYHYTSSANAETIRRDGLRMDRARGGSYGEGNGLWFSGRVKDWGDPRNLGDERVLVEVALPADTHVLNGGFQQTFVIGTDVPPNQILAIHEGWHDRYRYFVEEGMVDAVKAGEYDSVADIPDYGKAIEVIKRQGSMSKTAWKFPAPPSMGERVRVYKNLHRGLLSIMRRTAEGEWRVDEDFYVPSVRVTDVEFRVGQGGHERVLDEGVKNVHAFVIGDFAGHSGPGPNLPGGWGRARYNPKERNAYFDIDTGEDLGRVPEAFVTIEDSYRDAEKGSWFPYKSGRTAALAHCPDEEDCPPEGHVHLPEGDHYPYDQFHYDPSRWGRDFEDTARTAAGQVRLEAFNDGGMLGRPIQGGDYDLRKLVHYAIMRGDDQVGLAQVYEEYRDQPAVLAWLNISESHRRQGIASEAVKALQKLYPGIKAENYTDDGEKAIKPLLGSQAEKKDEPEPAIPRTTAEEEVEDGSEITPGDPKLSWLMSGTPSSDNSDIAKAATAYLAKTAGKVFTPAEQSQIINEGEGVTASNLDLLQIDGTHYADIEAQLASEEDDDTWLLG